MKKGGPRQDQMMQHELLSREEEQALGMLKESNPELARLIETILVENNVRLVAVLMRKPEISWRQLPDQDKLQAGMEGLMRAARKFDYSKGWRFATYARYWITVFIEKADEKERPIHLPNGKVEELRELNQVLKSFWNEGLENPTAEEIAKRWGKSLLFVEERLKLAVRKTTPLDSPVGQTGATLEDFLRDTNGPVDIRMEAQEKLEAISQYLDAIKEKESRSKVKDNDKDNDKDKDKERKISRADVMRLRLGLAEELLIASFPQRKEAEDYISSIALKGTENQVVINLIQRGEEWCLYCTAQDPLTLGVIGALYGVTRERIRQIEKPVMAKFMAAFV